MKEKAEEDAKNGDEEDSEEDDSDAPSHVDGEEKDEPTPQQLEAVQILADLVDLLG